jgi:hypothetical protein
MSTTFEPNFTSGTAPNHTSTTQHAAQQAAQRIRQTFTACRIKFHWLGTSKTLSSDQKTQAALAFGAEGDSISAGKKLIDTKHEAYKALTSLKSQITAYWKDHSLPYPEPGLRLIRQDRIDEVNTRLEEYRDQLAAAAAVLAADFELIKQAARSRLGSLYNESDYPVSLAEMFAVEWDFPAVDPPDYLRQLNPELYEQQSRRVAERFEQAVELAEQAFVEELDRLVNHLAERLSGQEDGRPKVFRDTAVTNLREFFDRFRDLNVGSSEQLDELVNRCEQLMQGVQPQGLRDNETFRQNLSTQLSRVQSSLDQMLVERPRRNILRPSLTAQTTDVNDVDKTEGE